MLLGSIPKATSRVTASHIYGLMLTVEQKAEKYKVGHCTDSASNALNDLLKLATPTQHLVKQDVSFLGLDEKSLSFYPLLSFPFSLYCLQLLGSFCVRVFFRHHES